MELKNVIKTAVVAFALGLASPLWGAVDYYVSIEKGNDANSGRTPSLAFRTTAKAVSVVQPGDTVHIMAGRYPPLFIRNLYGEEAQTIVFQPYQNDHVVFDRDLGGEAAEYAVRIFDAQHLVIRGFEVTDTRVVRLDILSKNPCVEADKEIIKTYQGAGVSLNGSRLGHITIEDMNIHRNARTGLGSHGGSPLGTTPSMRFLNNRIHHNGGYGVYVNGKNLEFRGNTIHDNNAYGIHIYYDYRAPENPLVEKNLVYNNGLAPCYYHRSSNIVRQNWGQDGLIIKAENGTVRNNIVAGNNGAGIAMWGQGGGALFANNTIFGNKKEGISDNSRSDNGHKIHNNIVYANKSFALKGNPHTQYSHNLTDDPRFVNAGARDFRLRADSPAIDAGLTLTLVTEDFLGTPRPQGQGTDIGAFEYKSGSSPDPGLDPDRDNNKDDGAQNPTDSMKTVFYPLRDSSLDLSGMAGGTDSTAAGHIEIFDRRGRRIKQVPLSGSSGSGRATWDGTNDQGAAVAAGVYVVVYTQGAKVTKKKVVVVK